MCVDPLVEKKEKCRSAIVYILKIAACLAEFAGDHRENMTVSLVKINRGERKFPNSFAQTPVPELTGCLEQVHGDVICLFVSPCPEPDKSVVRFRSYDLKGHLDVVVEPDLPRIEIEIMRVIAEKERQFVLFFAGKEGELFEIFSKRVHGSPICARGWPTIPLFIFICNTDRKKFFRLCRIVEAEVIPYVPLTCNLTIIICIYDFDIVLLHMIMRRLFPAFILFITMLFVFGCASGTGPVVSGSDGVQATSLDYGDMVDPVSASSSPTTSLTMATAAVETVSDEEDVEENLDSSLTLIESSQEILKAGDRENAIESLDRAYAAILNVPDNKITKEQLQQKEDLRYLISKRLIEIYTSRIRTTHGTSKEIPLVMNEYVEREIRSFQGYERDYFIESYRRSGRYRDMMVKAFQEAGIPEDITWLPLIESGFKVRAMSPARALGLWQFIPSTGYKYGLKRNDWIDERLDPEKATAAAIAYLTELHDIFGDWATVLAAYNCGEGNVLRAIRGQKIDYLDNFWDLYGRLPRETARYYPRFLAVLAIMKDPAKYGFTLGELDRPLSYEVVSVEKPVHLKKIAEKTGCSDEELASLNSELRFQATPASHYDLKVPVGKKEAVLACVDSLPRWSLPKLEYVVHKVRRGETLSAIARHYRMSVQRIREANNIRKGKPLRVGQRLKIPQRSAS